MRISDWSSDVCSSDLEGHAGVVSRDRGVLRSLGAGESLVDLVGVLGIGVAELEGMRTEVGIQPVLGGQAELVAVAPALCVGTRTAQLQVGVDRKITRLNSSH